MKRVYVLFFLDLASRRILFTACSEHVGGAWAALQARNLVWQLQNARCERWVSSVRRECLDRLLIVNRRHLEAILAEYNGHRPHRSLGLQPPRGSNVIPGALTDGKVVRRTRVHGLISEYSHQAA